MSQDKVRILRLYEFLGDREAVEGQIRESIQRERIVRGGRVVIRATTLGGFPEILERAEDRKKEDE